MKRETTQLRVLNYCEAHGIETEGIQVDVLKKMDGTRVFVHLPNSDMPKSMVQDLKNNLGVRSVKVLQHNTQSEQYFG